MNGKWVLGMSVGAVVLAAGCAKSMDAAEPGGGGTPQVGDPTLGDANLHTEEVQYKVGDQMFVGYLAYDKTKTDKRPGVIVVHEWWGHNDYARKRARMLATLGYVGFAIDMYGEGKKADHPKDAMAFAQEVGANLDAGVARFDTARAWLLSHPMVDGGKMAAIGYCFGGGVVLHMARIGADLKAVASFHGGLDPKQAGESTFVATQGITQARILVLNGAADPMVTQSSITAFEQEMANAKVDAKVVNYPGAKHGFTNPDATALGQKFEMPLAYDAAADRDSWAALATFLTEVFASPAAP